MIEFRWKGDTPPNEKRRACKDCRHLKGALSLLCTNDAAAEHRGTSIPGIRDCDYWEPMLPVEKKGFFKRLFDFEQRLIVELTVEQEQPREG